jgi:hypothetical protein
MCSAGVNVRVYHHVGDAHDATGSDDPKSDLASISYENLSEHPSLLSLRKIPICAEKSTTA